MRVLALVLLMSATGWGQSRSQARSMVITERGIVAASQTLASQAGAQILARGGSAMDAAIAANAVLAVVEPMSDGIGGDVMAIYSEAKTGRITGLNGGGWAPKGLTVKRVRDAGHPSMPQSGILSATVPGCVEGWERLHKRFGRLPWKDLFAPAIYYADHGFPLTELIAEHWRGTVGKLRIDEYTEKTFLRDGAAPATGQLVRNPDLASALRLIAERGAVAFYRGPIATAILETSRRLGGAFEAADLSEYAAEWVEPISTTYRGWKIYELPPPTMGATALGMLNLMGTLRLQSMAPYAAETLHGKIEAQKLAYQDARRYLADPRSVRFPAELLAKEYAAARAKSIGEKANCEAQAGIPGTGAGDTVYLTAVDRDGNIASLIQSVYLSWGSGVAVPPYGFHLHNRAGLFVLDEGHPNQAAPRKRPLHTIIPGLMERDSVRIGFGIMGGLNQPQAHAQFVSYIADHGMNIQAALEAPRFTKLNFGGCDVMLENRIPLETLEALRERGHRLEMEGEYSSWMGGGQAVLFDSKTGIKYGASSPQKDGAAVPEPEPFWGKGK
ncbi:MAG: gamma-glutamyltransferase family protein [Bryobacteraceae bacterium]|nr:gamma-glutamyltransferase family protein [Bryobacteraceae bacterium]